MDNFNMQRLNMQKHNTDGMLITFCGLDGCGKTTIIHMLSELIEEQYGKRIFLTRQPSTFIRQSDIFRAFMDKPGQEEYEYRSLSLMAAGDRIQHSRKVILPELQKGSYVISDRYIYSCIANLRARGYTKDKWIYEVINTIIEPDIAFFLDVPVETAITRVRRRADEKGRYIDMEFQCRLREEYLNLANKNKGIIIDSSGDEEETFEAVKEALYKKYEVKKTGGRL